MIIDRLEIANVGVVGETTVLDLRPRRGKPVVLIGGKNGSGKTTILEAIQWALYGRLAKSPRRSSGDPVSYQDYLKRLRHRSSPSDAKSYVELDISLRRGGATLPVKVRRSIQPGNRLTEKLEVVLDGRPLDDDQWPILMDSVLPTQLCSLFFFDGEQIEAMVDPARSRWFLRAGVHALLGVDLIDQLVADLETLERRERASAPETAELAKARALENELEQVERQLAEARQHDATVRTEFDQAEKALAAADNAFQLRGGNQYERRGHTNRQLSKVEIRRDQVLAELREVANRALPMCFLFAQLTEHHQTESELRFTWQESVKADAARRVLSELLEWLEERSASGETIRQVLEFQSLKKLGKSDLEPVQLPSSHDGFMARLEALLSGDLLQESLQHGAAGLSELDGIELEISDLSRSLASAPEEEDVRSLQDDVKKAAERRGQAQASLRMSEATVRQLEHEMDRISKTLESEIRKVRLAEHDADRLGRIAGACSGTRDLMAVFRKRMVKSSLRRIQSAMWKRFRQLLQKDELGNSIRIDPDSYELSVLDSCGSVLPSERFSAGERQLLATSVLWGLASVSGRRLPVIIDTPLGRLDRSHRGNLVNDYFPNAARQVILLSTDEEIDEHWLPQLEPNVARSFTLVFDDEKQSSTIQPGYFEELNVVA